MSHWRKCDLPQCDITPYFGDKPHTAITPTGRLSSPFRQWCKPCDTCIASPALVLASWARRHSDKNRTSVHECRVLLAPGLISPLVLVPMKLFLVLLVHVLVPVLVQLVLVLVLVQKQPLLLLVLAHRHSQHRHSHRLALCRSTARRLGAPWRHRTHRRHSARR